MKHIVICCGGQVGKWCLPLLADADFRIGADSGARFIMENHFKLDLAVGDFDSVDVSCRNSIKQYAIQFEEVDSIDKNDTDSGLALKKAMSLNPSKITLIGVMGSRYDHVYNNMQLLILAEKAGIPCEIVDNHNRIQLVSSRSILRVSKSRYKYVSLLPMSDIVTGITISGFKYPLDKAKFTQGTAYGVSNELQESIGTISVQSGNLLVIESID